MACGDLLNLTHEIEKGGCGGHVVVRETCKSLWCVECAGRRAGNVRRMIESEASTWKRAAHITLTMPSVWSLKSMCDTVQRRFRAVRRTRLWKRCVGRGFWSLGVSFRADAGWHVHIHVGADLLHFLPVKQLAGLWKLGSCTVNLRPANVVAAELAKGTKGDWKRLRQQAATGVLDKGEVEAGLHKTRMWGAFGGASLDAGRPTAACPHCKVPFVWREWSAQGFAGGLDRLTPLIAAQRNHPWEMPFSRHWTYVEWAEPS